MDVIQTIGKIIGDPSNFFKTVKKEDIEPGFKYYATILLIPTVIVIVGSIIAITFLSTIFASMFGSMAPVDPTQLGMLTTFLGPSIGIAMGILFYILMIVGVFIGSIILHVFVYIVGGRKGFQNTFKSMTYGMTPSVLLGWIPFVNIVIAFWTWYLEIKGISTLHEMTMRRAFLATLIPVLIVLAIVIGGVLFSMSYNPGTFPNQGFTGFGE